MKARIQLDRLEWARRKEKLTTMAVCLTADIHLYVFPNLSKIGVFEIIFKAQVARITILKVWISERIVREKRNGSAPLSFLVLYT